MAGRSVAPALYILGGSALLLVLGIAMSPRTTGPLVAYALGTFLEPISIIAALAIGALVPRAWIALVAGAVAAVAIHYIILSIDPDVAQLRRIGREEVSDTFVMFARTWGMVIAVAIVFVVAALVRRKMKPAAGKVGD